MSTWRSGPSPTLLNAWGTPAGAMTISPGPTVRSSSPSTKAAVPSSMTNTSAYGWRCSDGPWPGAASTKIRQTPTSWSAPTSSRAKLLNASSSRLRTLMPRTLQSAGCRADQHLGGGLGVQRHGHRLRRLGHAEAVRDYLGERDRVAVAGE